MPRSMHAVIIDQQRANKTYIQALRGMEATKGNPKEYALYHQQHLDALNLIDMFKREMSELETLANSGTPIMLTGGYNE